MVTTAQHRGLDGALYIEGAIPEIKIVDSNGHVVATKRVERGRQVRFVGLLGRGVYVLKAADLVCDGNCSVIDGPADGCQSKIEIGDALAVRVDFTVGVPCRITTVSA